MAKLTDKPCEAECPVRKTAEIIDGKWTTLIVRELLQGTKHYSELQRALDGISPKVLAARLRFLGERSLVKRTVHPTVPPTTTYELTRSGKRLEGVIKAMAKFGNSL